MDDLTQTNQNENLEDGIEMTVTEGALASVPEGDGQRITGFSRSADPPKTRREFAIFVNERLQAYGAATPDTPITGKIAYQLQADILKYAGVQKNATGEVF